MRAILPLFVAAVVAAKLIVPQDGTPQKPDLPKHITKEAVDSVNLGLQWLRTQQSSTGSFSGQRDGSTYSVSMAALAGMAFLASGSTTTRGPCADEITRVCRFIVGSATSSGMISSPDGESGRPMYGHGFSLLFLSSLYGMETDKEARERLAPIIRRAIRLTAAGQSAIGGWTYTPGSGDEGSVTITQMQALRAADAAGFAVPKQTIQKAVHYLELCQEKDGGIRYSYEQESGSTLPISAAAVATLYNAGEYDSKSADKCLKFVLAKMSLSSPFNGDRGGNGHIFYTNLYAAQAFYQAGGETWDKYFPAARDELIHLQNKDGSWNGDSVGFVYGTAIALIVMQLPYKFLPVFQR
ncbi:MAG: terpene cyclase/mutase family protein [Planctomycetes bacterium]|nr:terpene cyclase/mutase family protein [Planctomycetota bacterium]